MAQHVDAQEPPPGRNRDADSPAIPDEAAPLITSRFLFVDVAAQRAKQLRRGALPRLDRIGAPHKLERIAMEEVRRGVINYTLPNMEEVIRGRG